MPVLGRFGVLVLAIVMAGCAATSTPQTAADAPSDSLRAELTRLQAKNRTLQDSLRRYDDIESGQYDREMRVLQDQLNRLTYDLQLLRQGGLTVAVVPTDGLFESVRPDSVTDAGRERLRNLAAQLERTYPDRTVRVEGHTDDQPITGTLADRFPSNWELSSARAAAVVRWLVDGSALDRDQFGVVGYGSTRPVASNETAGGRRRNRRVRVAVEPPPADYSRPFETAW